MNNDLAWPAYFPYTFISPSLVELMSLFFRGLVIYQPAHAKPDPALQSWLDAGFLDLRNTRETDIDKRRLHKALRDLKSWGSMHQQADLALFKALGNAIEPLAPETPMIMSAVKSHGDRSLVDSPDTEFSAQLFLHLAQEFDRDAWEVRHQLERIDDQYRALGTYLRQDQEEDPCESGLTGRLLYKPPAEDVPGPLVARRVCAWNRLFQKDPAGPSLLFTDSSRAYGYLVEEVEEKVDLLNFSLVHGETGSGQPPRLQLSCVDGLSELFQKILTTSWSPALKEKAADARQKIASEIDAWNASNKVSAGKKASFCWTVVPGLTGQSLLSRRCGEKAGHRMDENTRAQNTLIGFIQAAW